MFSTVIYFSASKAALCGNGLEHVLFIMISVYLVLFDLKRECVQKHRRALVKEMFINIPSSEILEFPSVINFDIIISDDINFHFHFLPQFRNYFFSLSTYR